MEASVKMEIFATLESRWSGVTAASAVLCSESGSNCGLDVSFVCDFSWVWSRVVWNNVYTLSFFFFFPFFF